MTVLMNDRVVDPSNAHVLRARVGMTLGRGLRLAVALSPGLCAALASCSAPTGPYYGGGNVDASCTFDPIGCAGLIGGRCGSDYDCADGICCHDKNCGPGTCTYLCGGDDDCPPQMGCEHGYCFFRCHGNADCGPGQSCEHNQTVCEYK